MVVPILFDVTNAGDGAIHPIASGFACTRARIPSEQKPMADRPIPVFSPELVDEAAVDAAIEAKAIGAKIRRLRLKRSLGLVELGEQVGLSPSFLSQLETGRVTPTLRNLARIALVFKKELSYFFHEDSHSVFRVSRNKGRIRLQVGDKSAPVLISDSMSVLVPDRHIVPCIAEFLPGAAEAFHPHIFAGLEMIYAIDGSLIITTDNRTEVVEAQDSVWIDGHAKRTYRTNEDRPVRALIVSFAQQS
jgi:transcriptional regulator with XRE-family HTH domain